MCEVNEETVLFCFLFCLQPTKIIIKNKNLDLKIMILLFKYCKCHCHFVNDIATPCILICLFKHDRHA